MLPTLMSRVGVATTRLADVLGGLSAGDRIPNVQVLSEELGCGKGTVQAAFGLLEDAGALTLRSRGSRGTYVESVDSGLMWIIAGRRSVTIAMPLPYSRRYEGLASGLQASFAARGIPLSLAFMRGSTARLAALTENRADLVLLSQLAASLADNIELELVHSFGPRSYVGAHVVVLGEGHAVDEPGLRVAVDPTSTDQVNLVERVFAGQDISKVEISYNQLDGAFRQDLVDATVWNVDELSMHISAPFTTVDLPPGQDDLNTTAVIVGRSASEPLPRSVSEALADPLVTVTADDVVAGRLLPTY